MANVSSENVINFIHNTLFFEWVVRPTENLNIYWNQYVIDHPWEKSDIEEAYFLIKTLLKEKEPIRQSELTQIWSTIEKSIRKELKRKIRLKSWSIAAGIIIIIGISVLVASNFGLLSKSSVNYEAFTQAPTTGNNVKLILSDNSAETFSSPEVEIIYNNDGKVQTGSGEKIKQDSKDNFTEKEYFNQLIVPRGRRSNIILSDGSRLWLNSGSRAIYPVVFNKKCREIFIEGEAYIEVFNNPLKPFYVVTDQIKVKVLGTKFNISAYPDDNNDMVALVEGSVDATVKSANFKMKPNQLLSLGKESGEVIVEEVDVTSYIAWKEGWILCDKEKLEKIAVKLSRYYNVGIKYRESDIENMTLTGKLDLKNECSEVLNTICATAPLKYELSDSIFYLSIK
jgi:hypothetical protein